ncbi:MAG: hypothetical protein NVS9B7_25130 [Flavisolibacter sp.]
MAQPTDSSYLHYQWKASWISVAGAAPTGYGVYLFRKVFDLNTDYKSLMVQISADNRYKLFVNEKLISMGPARGDLAHWNYQTINIAPYLKAGKNVMAALVWNEGAWRPEAQISWRTGFIVQGQNPLDSFVNSNTSWKCIRDSSFQPLGVKIRAFYVAGPGEYRNMSSSIKNWTTLNYTDSSWKNAEVIALGTPKNIMGPYGSLEGWMLIPSDLPERELKRERFLKVRSAEGVRVSSDFLEKKAPLTIPAQTRATILLDQTYLTNAYFTLIFSGGKNSTISLSYAEALFSKYPSKGNRNEIEGKVIMGRKDSILSDGGKTQIFTSLVFRTYRFVQIQIVTTQEPLVIEDVFGVFTGFPLQFNAKFSCNDPELNTMLEIGWRTARLCAFETYTDCPYYEQLQYIGDTRIQALVSLYNSGDDRLLKNALNQMDHSRQPEGITESRHPSFTPNYIPTFSLLYIGMLHDYFMYGADSVFFKDKLPGVRQVLNYFRGFQQGDGSLKNLPYWSFTDWVTSKEWKDGVAPIGRDGCSAVLDLQLLWAFQLAADMEVKLGLKENGALYNAFADQLKSAIHGKYWDGAKMLFADRAEKDLFSQHANALAILTGLVSGTQATTLASRILLDTSLAPASIYFKYYLHQALTKAGLGNNYLSWLDIWRQNMKMGLTTWAEISDIDNARSDCHAWGASPNIEFFRTILGIDSEGPWFQRVKIEPHLNQLKNISGSIPHPMGKLSVQYQFKKDKWMIDIYLPSQVTGSFIWSGKTYELHEGLNHFDM